MDASDTHGGEPHPPMHYTPSDHLSPPPSRPLPRFAVRTTPSSSAAGAAGTLGHRPSTPSPQRPCRSPPPQGSGDVQTLHLAPASAPHYRIGVYPGRQLSPTAPLERAAPGPPCLSPVAVLSLLFNSSYAHYGRVRPPAPHPDLKKNETRKKKGGRERERERENRPTSQQHNLELNKLGGFRRV